MKVLYFGSSLVPLFGTLYVPQRMRSRSAAVLLCNPFGEEAVAAHRIYRVLATQLERLGYSTLRFDYSCTGDSMGESADASVENWLTDIEQAAEELRIESGARRLVAVGLRLGGTMAALATSRRRLRLRHLIMWDPVIDGAAYLQELAAMHRNYMRDSMGPLRSADNLQLHAGGAPTEALGTPIGPSLAVDLGAINLTSEALRAEQVSIISTHDTPALANWRHQLGESPAAKWIPLTASAEWNAASALNANVVPMNVVQAVVSRIEEVSQ